MLQKQKRFNNQNDPTAWELARREGISPGQYVKMNFTIMAKILLFVFVGSRIGELMGADDPAMGFIWTIGVIVGAYYLFRGIRNDYEN